MVLSLYELPRAAPQRGHLGTQATGFVLLVCKGTSSSALGHRRPTLSMWISVSFMEARGGQRGRAVQVTLPGGHCSLITAEVKHLPAHLLPTRLLPLAGCGPHLFLAASLTAGNLALSALYLH